MAIISTHHTYPDLCDLCQDLFHLSRISWDSSTVERAIAATLYTHPEAVILKVTVDGKLVAQGLKPAGLG